MLQEAYEQLPPSRALVPVGAGRPTKFRPEYTTQVERLCRLGVTDAELAQFFGIALSTLYLWKLLHPEFSDAEKSGKIDADAKVSDALYHKALSGDTTAQIFWLKNRRRKEWSDRQDVNVSVTINHENRLQRIARLEAEGKL